MRFKLFDSVVLQVDVAELGLRKGDRGAVVELYEPDGVEVEVLEPDGSTRDVYTLQADQLRPATKRELRGSRPLRRR
jgi:uncharacterized protein DUF4926